MTERRARRLCLPDAAAEMALLLTALRRPHSDFTQLSLSVVFLLISASKGASAPIRAFELTRRASEGLSRLLLSQAE
jgi:hypothetical protein